MRDDGGVTVYCYYVITGSFPFTFQYCSLISCLHLVTHLLMYFPSDFASFHFAVNDLYLVCDTTRTRQSTHQQKEMLSSQCESPHLSPPLEGGRTPPAV